MSKILTIFFIYTAAFFQQKNPNYELAEPTFYFKIIVLDRASLNNLFSGGVTEIIFQHQNPKGSAIQRRAFELIGYYFDSQGKYVLLPNSFFVQRAMPRANRFVEIKVNNDGATSNFGNLVLKKTDIELPVMPDPTYKYIVFYPQLASNNNYVEYEMYFAQNKDDNPDDKKIGITAVKTIGYLKPSPPY